MFKELEMDEMMDVNGGATATDMGDGTGNTVDRGFVSNMKSGLESYWKESREYLPKIGHVSTGDHYGVGTNVISNKERSGGSLQIGNHEFNITFKN
ncbi:hypothetical protein [Fusibacter sp. 3D3]|uniref:hypothetical protein n=1 Tax=Fusibacter sp. 3D3 TaxID=1048380 RepID=UPI000852C71E|nr:hypothetical protein [Fusibacter sp. 3D3]GAU79434.1 hypothetical protein F3D3_4098 [Fusibacter sp. 3D3]